MRITVQGWPSQVRRFGVQSEHEMKFRLETLLIADNLFQKNVEDEIRNVLSEQIQIEREEIAKKRRIPVSDYRGLDLDVIHDVTVSFDNGVISTRPTHPVITLDCLTWSASDFFRRWDRLTNERLKAALCERLFPMFNSLGGSHTLTVLTKDVEDSLEWYAVKRSAK